MGILQKVMERAGTAIKPVSQQLSEPFTQNGTANVACIFELSDGQTISVFFHNPDTTPKKILPTDEMVSWKWLLNKKDITIVVAPEKGKDLNVRQVATRLMKLAEKNSPAFQRANAKRAEKMQAIQGLKDEIIGLEKTLSDKQKELAVAKIEAEDRAAAKAMQEPDAAPSLFDQPEAVDTDNRVDVILNELARLGWKADKDGKQDILIKGRAWIYRGQLINKKTINIHDAKYTNLVTEQIEFEGSAFEIVDKISKAERDINPAPRKVPSTNTQQGVDQSPTRTRAITRSTNTQQGVDPVDLSLFDQPAPVEAQTDGESSTQDINEIEDNLIANADNFRDVPITRRQWDDDFPENLVNTPIGQFKLGENQFDKLIATKRGEFIGLVKPTLENPSYIIKDDRDGTIFIKAFVRDNGKIRGFASISYNIDGIDVVVSNHPKDIDNLAKKISSSVLLHPLQTVRHSDMEATTSPEEQHALAGGPTKNIPQSAENTTIQQGIDPVAKANIEAANISAAIKKKAIAYLNANPTSHKIEGISPKSLSAIMESIKTALFAEIKALSPLFKEEELYKTGHISVLRAEFGTIVKSTPKAGDIYSHEIMIGLNPSNILMFSVTENNNIKNIFDSSSTIEDLRSWGFALPFDLDVKAFVANVIKPVVDEFLSKQAGDPKVFTLIWSEASEVENKDFSSLNELQLFIRKEFKNKEANVPLGTYRKHKIRLSDKTELRVDVGRETGDFNPFKDNLSQYLKKDGYSVDTEPNLTKSQSKQAGNQAEQSAPEVAEPQVVEPTPETADPEDRIRALWTEQGVSKERQDELIADITEKAKNPFDFVTGTADKLKAFLAEGDLKAALDLLKNLNKNPLIEVLLRAGFPIAGSKSKTIKEVMDYVSPYLVKAASLKTDGYGVIEQEKQQVVEPTPEVVAEEETNMEETNKKTTGKIESINELVDIALSRKDTNKAFTEISEVMPKVAAKIKEATGIDVEGFVHGIDEAAIRHILKQHGDEKAEKLRGQIAVTVDDIAKIKDIVESPDEVTKGETLAGGIETVIYKKTVGATSVYVQEIRKSKGKLAAKTLWKVPVARDVLQDESPALTPETFNTHPPQGDQTIPNPQPDATENNAAQDNDIEEEIESLKPLIGKPEFSDALDTLIDKLEATGLESQYEQIVSDIINQDALAESAKVGI